MTAPTRFGPTRPIGPGRTVIEASAGTGKTFAIAAVFARLVALEGVPLERVLAVTFTRAATAELRSRVRTRLVASLSALEGTAPDEHDDHMAALLATDSPDVAATRIRDALSDFDRAQIWTIHGLAQRLLGQLGFRARLAATLEPGDLDRTILTQAASDLVVGRFAGAADGAVVGPGEIAAVAAQIIDHPDARVVPDPGGADGTSRVRVELGTATADEVRRRMRAGDVMTFDDGLVEVRDVLTDPDVGRSARALLQSRYDVGLIDESQDTDPVQWGIVNEVFADGRLVIIGDPKQSIYRFRGADIEAYLAAVDGAAHHTLTTNWRSDGGLVEALDQLFEGTTFGDERITYRRVEAATDNVEPRIHGVGAPLHLRLLSSELDLPRRNNGCFRVPQLRAAVAADAAAEVVRILSGGASIDDGEGTRPVGPADLAVLCRTRSQVDLVRQELERRGVPSVAARSDGVLGTDIAEEWRRFLLGVERPDRMDLVRMAAASQLVGHDLASLAELDDDAAIELQRQMRHWQSLLHAGGIPALIADLDHARRLSARILSAPDGERVMTDLVHVAEEMHAIWRRGRLGSLAAWLDLAMAEAAERRRYRADEIETRQRRLETDAAAVSVQTVHGAKGLEFPVVLAPFEWDARLWEPDFPVFHAAEPGPGGARPRILDVGGKGGPDFAEHVALSMAEEAAEESRLLYVALTRARHHVEVWWVENFTDIGDAKLTELVAGNGRTPENLAAASGGNIAVSTLSEPPATDAYAPPADGDTTLAVAAWERDLDHMWRRASFSSLSAEQPLAASEERAEHPLRADDAPVAVPDETPVQPGTELPMAELPAGARFGTLVHDVLERLPFDSPDLEGEIERLFAEEMRRSLWDIDGGAFVAGLAAALRTPLGPGDDVSLSGLGGVLRELRFDFPVTIGGGSVSLVDVGRVMTTHLAADDPYRPYAEELLGAPAPGFRGYLTGAIDLVARFPDGRFVVMDYKSNALPARGPAPSPFDYGPDALVEQMISHRYVLQATLYQVALHRYLQWRLPGYDPATHLGGSVYLFLRGVTGPDTPVVDGERCGVARWRPPTSMTVELSRLFEGAER